MTLENPATDVQNRGNRATSPGRFGGGVRKRKTKEREKKDKRNTKRRINKRKTKRKTKRKINKRK